MANVRNIYFAKRAETWKTWAWLLMPHGLSGMAHKQKVIRPTSHCAGGGIAQSALREARIDKRWDDADGYYVAEMEARPEPDNLEPGRVRLLELPEEGMCEDDLFGDVFDPNVNSDIPPERLERERQEAIDRVNRDGVWVYAAQYFDPLSRQWVSVDSIGGIIGGDLEDSGHGVELRESALDGLAAAEREWARAIEAGRPDMYGLAADA